MKSNNDSAKSNLWRIIWKVQAFHWLKENRQYTDFSIDSCLKKLEENLAVREVALAAFWGTYLSTELSPVMEEAHLKSWYLTRTTSEMLTKKELPPVMEEAHLERVRNLLDYGSLRAYQAEDIEALAFVKLHLAGLLAICIIRPDWPIIENPSVVYILEKALEAYRLAEKNDTVMEIVDAPSSWGNKYFYGDLFTFSSVLVCGIAQLELSLIYTEQRNYEDAFLNITNSAWHICATTIQTEYDPGFYPYLPHSGKKFNIQEVANIFEEVKKHCRDIKNWEKIRSGCEAIKYLGYNELYNIFDDIKDTNGDAFSALEYWGKAITFAEDQMRIVSLPFIILTKDASERAETRDRLQRDLFRDGLWDEIEEKSRDILIDAEIDWMHNRLDNMVKEIRQILELTLTSLFPFLEHTISQQSDGHLILTRMKVAMLKNRMVRASINSLKINDRDKKFTMDELPNFLQDVIETRNYFEKESHLESKKPQKPMYLEKAVAIHNKLLGVGCEGILPWLMKIKKATRSKSK